MHSKISWGFENSTRHTRIWLRFCKIYQQYCTTASEMDLRVQICRDCAINFLEWSFVLEKVNLKVEAIFSKVYSHSMYLQIQFSGKRKIILRNFIFHFRFIFAQRNTLCSAIPPALTYSVLLLHWFLFPSLSLLATLIVYGRFRYGRNTYCNTNCQISVTPLFWRIPVKF